MRSNRLRAYGFLVFFGVVGTVGYLALQYFAAMFGGL